MSKAIGRYLSMTAAAAAVALFAFGAQAQEKKMDTPKAAAKTEKKTAACNTLKTQAPCETRTDCNWVAEAKDAKGKVTKKAYCRGNPGTMKKAEPKKTEKK